MESALGISFSHYRIVEKLGEGGMGVVYLAEDTLLGRRVAIKFPSAAPSHRKRLLVEARAASSLNHPAIAAIYDCGEYEDRPYVVMELVEGRSLNELLRAGPIPAERSIEIAAAVAEALEEAHRRHIVHRDIKPANIRIGDRGAVKVVDFGLAKDLRDARVTGAGARAPDLTQTTEGICRRNRPGERAGTSAAISSPWARRFTNASPGGSRLGARRRWTCSRKSCKWSLRRLPA
jgi:serine/threonine protein kinase